VGGFGNPPMVSTILAMIQICVEGG